MRQGGCGGGAQGKEKRVAPKEGKKDVYPKENWAEAEKLYNKDEEIDEAEEYEKYEEQAYGEE